MDNRNDQGTTNPFTAVPNNAQFGNNMFNNPNVGAPNNFGNQNPVNYGNNFPAGNPMNSGYVNPNNNNNNEPYQRRQTTIRQNASNKPENEQENDAEKAMLTEWFAAVDQDGGGAISAEELQQALRAGGENFSIETTALMIKLFDNNGNGSISVTEFISLFRYIQAIRESFNLHDLNKDEKLEYAEVKQAIEKAQFHFTNDQTFNILFR